MNHPGTAIPRRRALLGIAMAGSATGGMARAFSGASPGSSPPGSSPGAPLLGGTDFALEIGPVPIDIGGRPRTALGVNGMTPAPILRWREGDTVTLRVANRLREPTSLHWHGVRVPSEMDGSLA